MSVVTNIIIMNYAVNLTNFPMSPLSLSQEYMAPKTHIQRFITVSPVTTCWSSILPVPPTWRVFVLPSTRVCVHSCGVHFHFHSVPLPLVSLSLFVSLPFSSPQQEMSAMNRYVSVLWWCQGQGWSRGIYCQMCLRTLDKLNPEVQQLGVEESYKWYRVWLRGSWLFKW